MDENRAGEQVNEKAQELIEEFVEHYEEYVKAHPDQTDRNKIFQGWAIQKIAGLQLAVLDLGKSINALATNNQESQDW